MIFARCGMPHNEIDFQEVTPYMGRSEFDFARLGNYCDGGSMDAHRVTAYSTMALALVTVVLAGATVFLAISNNDVVKEMRASERPLIWVGDFGQPFFAPVTVPSDKGKILWDYGWTNFGKSPAINVKFR